MLHWIKSVCVYKHNCVLNFNFNWQDGIQTCEHELLSWKDVSTIIIENNPTLACAGWWRCCMVAITAGRGGTARAIRCRHDGQLGEACNSIKSFRIFIKILWNQLHFSKIGIRLSLLNSRKINLERSWASVFFSQISHTISF